jgi:hypothetical protein
LGYRLNGLLNAMRLAELLDVEFRFTWPLRGQVPHDTTHAIVPAEKFFSADFLAAYQVDAEVASTGFVPPRGREIDLEALRAQIGAADRGLLAPGSPLANRIDPKAVPEVARGFSEEFARIGFHPQIDEAIRAAREVPLDPATVGIHLRAGDHIYGRFRLLNRFWDKTVPAPIARELITRSRADGAPVIVFGQDAELIAELCDSTGAVDAATMRPTSLGDRSAEAMFDLILMSRCEHILSGDSGFAVQAAAISDKQAEFHVDLITPEESLRITRSDLERNGERYHPVQRAFAWWVAYYRVRHDIPYDEAAEMLGAAIEGDPDNPRSRLRLAALSYREGDVTRGDEVLTDALIADVAPGRDRLRSVIEFSRMRGRGFDSDEIVEDFERAAANGSGPATIYRAAIRARRGEVEGAVADGEAFRKHAAAEPRLAGLAGFDALVEATMKDRLGELEN